MTEGNGPLALRIPEKTRDALMEVMKKKDEKNISKILRKAIDEYLMNHHPRLDIEGGGDGIVLRIKLNERAYRLLYRLKEEGIITSLDEGIRQAIPSYCRGKMSEYKELEDAFQLESAHRSRKEEASMKENPFNGYR